MIAVRLRVRWPAGPFRPELCARGVRGAGSGNARRLL